MAEHDNAFLKLAVQHKLLTPPQQQAAAKALALLARNGIDKSFAEVCVEAGWLKPASAAPLMAKVQGHPPLRTRQPTPAETAAAADVGGLQRGALEQLAGELAKLGYKRDVVHLMLDKGVLKPADAAPAPRGGTRVTGKREGTRVTGTRPRQTTMRAQKSSAGLFVGIAVGAVVLVGAIAFLAMGGGGSGEPPKKSDKPLAGKPEPAPAPATTAAPRPEPPKTVAPPPISPEEQMRRDIEEGKKQRAAENEQAAEKLYADGFQQMSDSKWDDSWRSFKLLAEKYQFTDFVKTRKSEIAKLVDDAKNRRLAPPPAKPDDTGKTPAVSDAGRADYDKRVKERLDAAKKRLDAAKAAIQSDRAAEAKRWSDVRAKIAAQKFQLRTRTGQYLRNASIVELGRADVRLSYDSDGAPVTATVAWDTLDDPSFAQLARAVYADQPYELGRQLITRKLWKDAKAAFDVAVKADPSLKDRVPDLAPILANQGAFRAQSRRLGRDGLALTWDFAAPEQAEDFQERGGGTKSVSKGLELEAGGQGNWTIKDVEYAGEVEIETSVTVGDDCWAAFSLFMNWEGNGYTFQLSSGDKGFEFARHTGDKRDVVQEKPDEKLSGTAQIKISAKGGAFKLFVNGKEVISATDATHTKGWCGIGVWRGKATYGKLAVTGKVNPIEIDKRFAESEVLVRRALEGDLTAKGGARTVRDIVLSAEDPYLMRMLKDDEKDQYARAKEKALRILQAGITSEDDLQAVTLFNPIISAAPEFYAALYWRGRLSALFNDTVIARRDFVRCTKDPNFHEALTAAGATWDDDQDYEKALWYADEALKRAPDYAPAVALKGYLQFVLKADSKAALADLELAMRLDPADDDTRAKHRSIANVVKGPEHLGCKFKKEFPHYIVMTDISAAKTQLYGERLETAYKYYGETFKDFFKEDPKRIKPRVAIFNTREAYMTYSELTLLDRAEFTLGYFMPPFRELLLFEDVEMDDTLQTLYHEAFHQFMMMMVARPPYWYNEGIAEYMGGITIEGGAIKQKGRILEGRLKGLKRHLDMAFPFENLMKQSPGAFYSGPASFKYAQAWSMIHFFYEHEKGKHRKLIDAYYRALLEGKEIDEAYDAAFGGVDMKALQAEWRAYAEKMELPKPPAPPPKK